MLDPLEAAVQEALMLEGNEELPTGALTIAFLDGAPQSQSWLGFARSLASAQRYAAPGGAIVLVTQLSQAVGSGLNRLRDPHRQSDSIAKKLATDNSDDAWAASVLLQANSSFHVYLISKLRAEIVESLGMGAIADEAQLSRLIEQFESCTIVKAAQHLGACSAISPSQLTARLLNFPRSPSHDSINSTIILASLFHTCHRCRADGTQFNAWGSSW